jgi:hypothetical protein
VNPIDEFKIFQSIGICLDKFWAPKLKKIYLLSLAVLGGYLISTATHKSLWDTPTCIGLCILFPLECKLQCVETSQFVSMSDCLLLSVLEGRGRITENVFWVCTSCVHLLLERTKQQWTWYGQGMCRIKYLVQTVSKQ